MFQARRMYRIVLTLALLTCGVLLTAGAGCDENVTDQIQTIEMAQAMDVPGGPTYASKCRGAKSPPPCRDLNASGCYSLVTLECR